MVCDSRERCVMGRGVTHYALVRWKPHDAWEDGKSYVDVEEKRVLAYWSPEDYTVLCDDQPKEVLLKMLALTKEQ